MSVAMKALTLLLACALLITGCNSNQTQQALFSASLARIIILEQQPGPKRDQILREFDAAVLAGNLLLAEQKAQEAAKLVPTTQAIK